EQIQSQLESLRREKGELEKQERKEQWVCQEYLEKVKAERQKIVPEFKQLRQYLEEQECLLLARLGELEKQIGTRLQENAAKFSVKIIYLNSLIKEQECQLSGHKSLQLRLDKLVGTAGSVCAGEERKGAVFLRSWPPQTTSLCWWCYQASQVTSGFIALSDALATDQGERVEESLGLYTKVNVTLDPDTAQSWLVLSEDQRSVMRGSTQQSRLDNPERFNPWPCVLGCEGFNSGRPCWEVEVGYGSCWAVGVALESVKRKGQIDMSPTGGIWAVGQYKEMFQALTSPSPTPVLPGTIPQRVRICLDHAGGQVMFINVDSEAVIFTFPQTMFAGEQIHPWFWVGKGSQLKLCPET
ncbi:PREDICTED: zinc finger protein RFP-like, partial [Pterocles gutturalis]